jgi:putative ABC transport system permease protein
VADHSRSWLASVLLALYPREFRARCGPDFIAAHHACLVREAARLGRAGVLYAVLRTTIDSIWSAAVLHVSERRRERIAATHNVPHAQKGSVMDSLWQDIRYAARGMRRAPGFTAAVVSTLAIAIGANTAMFAILNAVLLRPLPFTDADRLVMVYEELPGAIAFPLGFSPPDFVGFERRTTSLQSIAAFRNKDFELSGVDQPERITAAAVSGTLFETLGVTPAIGQAFTREDDKSRRPVAVLSDGLWRRKFGGDPGVIGRAVILDRTPHTIVGVMPRGFTFPNRGPHLNNIPAELYVPIAFTAGERVAFGSMYNNSVVGRLRSGITVDQAQAEVKATVSAQAAELYPAYLAALAKDLTASVVPLRDEIVGRSRAALRVLFAAVACVLLIACADIANLMLTRGASREREIAVRAALGAGRARLIQLTLVESLILAVSGGVIGLLLSRWISMAVVRFAPANLPRLNEISMDVRVLAFAAGASLVTALLCGVLPALEISRRDAGDALKDGGRTGTPGRRQRRTFGGLVVAQFALAVVLLVCGGLLIRSFARLSAVEPGFRADHVLTFAVSLPGSAYRDGAAVRAFYGRLMEAADRLPGVSASGASTDLPLSVRERRAFSIETPPTASRGVPRSVAHDWVMGRYFEALGIELKRGRVIGPPDGPDGEPVIVVNETMARRFWPGEDPIGQRIAWGTDTNHGRWMRIVGIVSDVKQGPLSTAVEPQTYSAWLQVADQQLADNVASAFRGMKISLRTPGEPTALASAVRGTIQSIDPSLPITAMQTMEQVVETSIAPQRFNTVLLGSFATVALLLAALGIAGVLSTSVSRRTQELGVRMALGAQRNDLLLMVVRQGMTLVVLGLAIGLVGSLFLARWMSSLLFGIEPRDPLTFAGVAAVLTAVAFVACYIPARRTTRIDPIVALRCE